MARLVVCAVLVASIIGARAQIGFPESNEDDTIKNRDHREPVYAPTKCPENELFYPGDQKSDWICDCRPAYLFHPLTDKCHAAYRRGPCLEREYLILPADSVIPKCVSNPCLQDRLVPFNNACARLDSIEPCLHTHTARPQRLAVNATSLLLECAAFAVSMRLGGQDEALPPPPPCPLGCRRSVNMTRTDSSSYPLQ